MRKSEIAKTLIQLPSVLHHVIEEYLQFQGILLAEKSCPGIFPGLPRDCVVMGNQLIVCFEIPTNAEGDMVEFKGFDRSSNQELWSVKSSRYPLTKKIWTWEARNEIVFAVRHTPSMQCFTAKPDTFVKNWLAGFFVRHSDFKSITKTPEIVNMILPKESYGHIICFVRDPDYVAEHRSVWFMDTDGKIQRQIRLARDLSRDDGWQWWELGVAADECNIYLNHWTGIRVYSQENGNLVRVMPRVCPLPYWQDSDYFQSFGDDYFVTWNASCVEWTKEKSNITFHPKNIVLWILHKKDGKVYKKCCITVDDAEIEKVINQESQKTHFTFSVNFLHLYVFPTTMQDQLEVLQPILSKWETYC